MHMYCENSNTKFSSPGHTTAVVRATTNAEKNHVASPPIFSKEGKIVKDTALYPGSAAVLEYYGVLV